jgi:hypothetical protein
VEAVVGQKTVLPHIGEGAQLFQFLAQQLSGIILRGKQVGRVVPPPKTIRKHYQFVEPEKADGRDEEQGKDHLGAQNQDLLYRLAGQGNSRHQRTCKRTFGHLVGNTKIVPASFPASSREQ